jgi:glutamate decarboxylase
LRVPRNTLPAGEVEPDTAYQMIHDELMLDGNARLHSMLSRLWSSPDAEQTPGCSTIASSEACMLRDLALKRRWRHARHARRASRPTGPTS